MADAMLRSAIMGEVSRALREYLEHSEEKWISSAELTRTFSFFTKDWLRHNGHLLPRERVCVVTDDEVRTTGWGYPLHRIERMLAEGQFRSLEYKENNP